MSALKIGTDTLSQLLCREQRIRFNHGAFAVDPLGLNRVEPGAFCRQKERQDAYACVFLFDLRVVCTNPGAHLLAVMPGSIIPDQEPGGFPLLLQLGTTPVQKLGCDGTHRTPRDKTQPHLISHWIIDCALLPQHAITGQCFGIRIALFPGTFVPVLTWEGKCSCRRAKPASFGSHLPVAFLREVSANSRGGHMITHIGFCW